ncbi:MAG: FAD-binding domain-containing protein [Acidimicrobiales bacterium]
MTQLPTPGPGEASAWVGAHLAHLVTGEVRASPRFRGGQTAADTALASFDVSGYAARRNEVWPSTRRGASGLSPWIRHGLLTLPEVWSAVGGGPARDVAKLRDELLWQEFARHWYARLGPASAQAQRAEPRSDGPDDPWAGDLACVRLAVDELERDGWLVNQTRMWLASHWTVRSGSVWTEGEDRFFRHLLDGSRAANRLGWQWTVGAMTGEPYGFSRWQVTKRAPGLCRTCPHQHACPIEHWPDGPAPRRRDPDPLLRQAPTALAGPRTIEHDAPPSAVWLTAESIGARDPAAAAHPDLPAVFVFDEPLLERLRLAAPRLVFLAECLASIAEERELEVHLGDPVAVLAGRPLSATFTPVPGWRRRSQRLDVVERHPWPWLRRPGTGPVSSFSAWRNALGRRDA